MPTRIFLGFSVVLWLPYGLFCLFQPSFLEGAAGVSFGSPTGSTELRAMYGGLQSAIGLLALAGALRPDLARTALLALAFLCAGLGSARLLGAFVDGGVSAYTVTGLVFEFASLAVCVWLLRPEPGAAAV